MDIIYEYIKMKGFDYGKAMFQIGNIKRQFRGINQLPVVDHKYIVINSIDIGILLFDFDLNLIKTIDKLGGNPLSVKLIYNRLLVFSDEYAKKMYRYDTYLDDLHEVEYDSLFKVGITHKNYHFTGFREIHRCYHLPSLEVKWQYETTKDELETVRGIINNYLICSGQYNKSGCVILRDIETGKKVKEISKDDYSELRHLNHLGAWYMIENSFVASGPLPPVDHQDQIRKGKRCWYSINVETKKLNWFLDIEHPLVQSMYADNCNYSIYYHLAKKEFYYRKIDFVTGQILEDICVHDQIMELRKEDPEEYEKRMGYFTFNPIVVSEDYFYFGFCSLLIEMDKRTHQMRIAYVAGNKIQKGRIINNYLFTVGNGLLVFEGTKKEAKIQ